MEKRISLMLGLVAMVFVATGCATYMPVETERGTTYRLIENGCCDATRVAVDFGTSHRLAKFNQIYNPDAEKNLEPVTGMDGSTVEAVREKYHKGFEKETPRPVYNVNVGGLIK